MKKKSDIPQATKSSLWALAGYHHRAIELRYEGKTSKEICGVIATEFKKGVHPVTIKKWFQRNGLLYQEYIDYARAENDSRRSLMREEIKKLLPQVPMVLSDLINRFDSTGRRDPVALAAVDRIVSICGITADDDDKGEDPLKELFKRLEEAPEVEEIASPAPVASK